MKKRLLLFSAATLFGGLVLTSYSGGPATNNQGNRTGLNPATAGCAGSGCHGGKSSSVQLVTITLLDGSSPVTSYMPGKQYTVALAGSNSAGGHAKYGFQISCVTAGTTTAAGTFSAGATTGVGLANTGSAPVLENKVALTGQTAGGANSYTPLFNWTAPAAASAGSVKFYAVLNSVNGDAQANNADNWDTTSSAIYTVNTTGVGTAATTTLQVFPNPVAAALQVQGLTGAAELQVVDASGRIVAAQHVTAGQREATIPVAALPTGLYGLRVQSSGQVQGQLFFKQ